MNKKKQTAAAIVLALTGLASGARAQTIQVNQPQTAVPSSQEQIPHSAPGARVSVPLEDPGLAGQGVNQGGTEPFSADSSSPTTSPLSPSPSLAEYNSDFEHWRRTNPVGGMIRGLANDGVVLHGEYIENLAGNPVGGEARGFAASQWVDAGAEFDLDRLIGWRGAIVNLAGAWFWGRSVGQDYIGNSISFQQTWRPVPGPRLTLLTIEQNLLHDRINLMVGRASVNSYYATSPLNCDFMSNTSCLALYGPISDIGITAFPNSSWAGKARVVFTRHIYGQFGAFEYDNALNTEGRGGLDFATSSATGFVLPGEAGYESSFADDRYPRLYRFGFYYNSASAADPYFNRNGQSAALTRTTPISYAGGRLGLYSIFDQTVWRLRPNTQDNLKIFGRVFYNAGNPTAIDHFISGGFVLTGPFSSRHEDTVAFLLTDTHFSAREIRDLAVIRSRAGGSGNPEADEIIGEVNYGYEVVPGIRLVPNIQYDINPDPIYAPHARTNIPDAVVLGLKIDVHIAELLGGRYTPSPQP